MIQELKGKDETRHVLIISMCSRLLSESEFVLPIKRAVMEMDTQVKTAVSTMHYSEVSEDDLSSATHIILSGNPVQDNEFAKKNESLAWIAKTDKHLLGICAGMQAIAVAFGGSVVSGCEIGMQQVTPKVPNLLFSREFDAYCVHGHAVPLSISKHGFEVLSESGGHAQSIKHNDKMIFGLMFHPEVRNQDIIWKFLQLE